MPAVPIRRRLSHDVVLAAACSLAVLVLYLWTLQPGLGGPEDTPKFQCLGYALGTAHPPGYPLYTILTHLFSYLPIRTVPWRANAFSALCGALSIAFVWGAARQLGASRLASTGAAFGLAFSGYFWWNAILAEVYTLGTALEAALLFFLLRWQRTRQVTDLHAAVAAAAFALGNHLTIIALAPACLLFALLVDWRQASRPRTVAINLLLGVAGLSTYSYILIRTWMGGAHLESRARNLAELFTIMRATRFSKSIGFTPGDLFTLRLPLMVGELLGQVTIVGAIVAVAGLAFLAWKNWRAALLLGGGLLGALLLAADVSADIKGFLMPALVLTWLLVASGMEVAQRALERMAGARTALAVMALLASLVPAHLLATNYDSNNLRSRTSEARYFDALFKHLPPGAALVADNYVINSLIGCQRILAGRSSDARVDVIPASMTAIQAARSSGRAVFAFEIGSNAALAAGYRVSPIVLQDSSLRARLDALPSGTVIVVAATVRGLPADLGARSGPAVQAWRAAQGQLHHVIVAAPGRWSTAEFTSSDDSIDRLFPPGTRMAGAGPSPARIRAISEGNRAAVSVRGRQAANVENGIAVVAVGPEGDVLGSWTYAAGAPLTVPIDAEPGPVYQVGEQRECRAVGDGNWHDVSDLADQGALFVRFDNARPAVARLSLYVVADHEPAPAVRAQFSSPSPKIEHRVFDRSNSQDAAALAAALESDGVTLDATAQRARFVVRDDLAVADRGQQAYAGIYLGGRPQRVFASGRTDRMTAPRVLVCEDAVPPLKGSQETTRSLPLGPSTPYYFGAGWRKAERPDDVSAPHRWTVRPRARLVVPIDTPVAVNIQLHVQAAPGVTRIAAELNGHPLPWRTLSDAWQDVSWPTDVSMWQSGLNDLTLVTDRVHEPAGTDRDQRVRGVDVAGVEFRPQGVGGEGR